MKKYINSSGITLIETLMSIAIFTVLLLAINLLFISLYRQQGADIGLMERTQSANSFLDIAGREIREANRAENGNFTLANAGTGTLTFFSDIDDDNLTEKISYFLQGTDLKKTVIEPGTGFTYAGVGITRIIISGVQNGTNPIFTYYDKDYTGAGSSMTLPINVLDVKLVGISLDLNSSNRSAAYPLHFETKIQLRNL